MRKVRLAPGRTPPYSYSPSGDLLQPGTDLAVRTHGPRARNRRKKLMTVTSGAVECITPPPSVLLGSPGPPRSFTVLKALLCGRIVWLTCRCRILRAAAVA